MLLNNQHRSVHNFDEPLSDGRIQKGEHIEVAFHIQKATGLFIDSELSPSNDLEEFLEGAEPAGMAMNPSARSAMMAFRSCIDSVTRRSDSPVKAISFSTSDLE
jgi:hypothetical protein